MVDFDASSRDYGGMSTFLVLLSILTQSSDVDFTQIDPGILHGWAVHAAKCPGGFA
jgi:hypothetical protein